MKQKRVRWGLLSTARINERLIPCIRDNVRSELCAVASRTQTSAECFADTWKIPCAYGSYEALLSDPEIDIIYVPLPNAMHAEWVVKCADAGKHVLCEKPLAISPEEVDRLIEAARRNRVLIQEAAMMRYHEQMRKVQALVAQRAIGDVRVIQGLFTFTLLNTKDIRVNSELGGGALWDLGSYCVSFMRTILQAEPTEVLATQIAAEQGVDRSFGGQLRFLEGALGQFFCSFDATPRFEANIIGTAGTMHFDLPWLNNVGVDAHVKLLSGGAASPDRSTFGDDTAHLKESVLTYPNVNAYTDEVDAVVSSILDDVPPVMPLEDSRRNIETVTALYRSAREGRRIVM